MHICVPESWQQHGTVRRETQTGLVIRKTVKTWSFQSAWLARIRYLPIGKAALGSVNNCTGGPSRDGVLSVHSILRRASLFVGGAVFDQFLRPTETWCPQRAKLKWPWLRGRLAMCMMFKCPGLSTWHSFQVHRQVLRSTYWAGLGIQWARPKIIQGDSEFT